MKKELLISALKKLKVETGSIACIGCGLEHDCSVHGCRIIREAIEQLNGEPQPVGHWMGEV